MTLGEIAYNAWCESLEILSHPAWDQLTPEEKIAWEYAAHTIKDWIQ
jgi:hypothetical protein